MFFGKKNKSIVKVVPTIGELCFEDGWWIHYPAGDGSDCLVVIEFDINGPSNDQIKLCEYIFENKIKLLKESKLFSEKNNYFNMDDKYLYNIVLHNNSSLKNKYYELEFTDKEEIEIHRLVIENDMPVDYGCDT